MTTTLPRPPALARHWQLDPTLCYLNHGSFGATPTQVLAAQQRHRDRMERDAVQFFIADREGLLDAARGELSALVGCEGTDLAFVPNATQACATILANLRLESGDEVVVNDQEYPACRNIIEHAANRAGARVVTVSLPFPVGGPDEVSARILDAVGPRTRLVLVSHVTSPTGLILPVAQIVAELNRRGVASLVDGAHAPGFLPLDIRAIDPTFYIANCHKWVCSPKGSAMMYVRRERQAGFRPLALSNSADAPRRDRSHFLVEFDFVGTTDPSAYLAIADAIRFMAVLVPGGWGEIMKRNRALALAARAAICRELEIEPPAPESMLGALAAVVLPAHEPGLDARLTSRPTRFGDALQDTLLNRHRIQVPIWRRPGSEQRLLRISAQLYNGIEQYEYLAKVLAAELANERAMA